jgi:hypothetical protein
LISDSIFLNIVLLISDLHLQTDQAEASKPLWETQGDFQTTHPLPVVKVKLYTESSGMLSLDDKELGRVLIKPSPFSPRTAEWHGLQTEKKFPDQMKIKIIVRMDRPQNLKVSSMIRGIVIGWPLRVHYDTPYGWPNPGRPFSPRPANRPPRVWPPAGCNEWFS